ncbi:hypothetical protein DH2020_043143 [Rehmannia glutinosa]|uniref:Uncharacterized protein n=1 Tax=Rehmannia glutinosa TaxID=99300 RepID=A0ABR0UKK9_REHGL
MPKSDRVHEMSGGLSGGSDCSLDADDLVEIRERFKEWKLLICKNKQLTVETSKVYNALRFCGTSGNGQADEGKGDAKRFKRLEFHVKTLSESREEDKKRIANLERELSNCSQEIDYLQDQLNMRNSDLGCPGEQVCSLHLKLTDMGNPVEEVGRLREQLKMSESEKLLLIQEIEDKEVVIRNSASRFEKLEESISSMALEYQCEIESTKLELISLEQNLFETEKLLEEKAQENSRLNELIRDLQLQNLDANKVIVSLEKENKDLKEKLQMPDMNTEAFVEKVKEQFHEWLEETDNQSFSKLEKDVSTYGTVLGPLFSKLAIPRASDADLGSKMAEMSHQIDDYELLVRRLKDELREERLKAKEEAEDLAQEMAELRYQLTLMLEEECKRRANVEQISLHRIAELEAQIAKERKRSIDPQDIVVRNQ